MLTVARASSNLSGDLTEDRSNNSLGYLSKAGVLRTTFQNGRRHSKTGDLIPVCARTVQPFSSIDRFHGIILRTLCNLCASTACLDLTCRNEEDEASLERMVVSVNHTG